MKFKGIFFVLILCIFLIGFSIPVITPIKFGGGQFGGGGAGGEFTTDIAEGNADYITDIGDLTKWENLSRNWKQNLLDSGFFSGMDNLFNKIKWFFLVLFGDSYSFSLFFFFVVVLWLWFLFWFRRILKITIFSKWVALIISFGMTIGLAQLGLYKAIANLFVNLIFLPKNPGFGIVIFFFILMFLGLLTRLEKILEKILEKKIKKNKEALVKEEEKGHKKVVQAWSEGLSENK